MRFRHFRRLRCMEKTWRAFLFFLFYGFVDRLDNLGRDSRSNDVVGNIVGNDRPCCNDRVVADRYSLQDRSVGAYPDVFPEPDGSRIGCTPILGSHPVVERGENYVVADLASVAEGYASVVLEMAAGVDEDILADVDILPEIGVKRRKYP